MLHHAIEKNKRELVKALIERGADNHYILKQRGVGRHLQFSNNTGGKYQCTRQVSVHATPSSFAALINEAPVAQLSIKAGCDVALPNARGQTAEEVAQLWSSLDFLQIMHEKDESYKNEFEKRTKVLAKHGGELLQLKTFQDNVDSSLGSLRMSGTLNGYLSCLISTPGIGTVINNPEEEKSGM